MRQAKTMWIATAMLTIVAGAESTANAATIPFTFEVTGGALIFGAPSAGALALPTTVSGSVSYSPFGSATYLEAGTAYFSMLPSGEFALSQVMNTFLASFPGGVDTISGRNSVSFGPAGFSVTLTIDGGTGIFSGASGSGTGASRPTPAPDPGDPLPVSFAGTGEISAPGLAAVPEPGSLALFGTGLAGLAGLAFRRRKERC